MAEPTRIQKVLADAGVASRRSAEELVAAGRVTVNGVPAVIGQRVDADGDRIRVDGHPLRRRPERVWMALHKPAGVTSTVSDRHAQWTVLDYVPPEVRRVAARLYPVGRLDQDSEGLLLLTNDGDWAQRVLHPRYEVEREYAIGLRIPLTPDQVRQLTKGILLEEGMATLRGLRAASGVEIERMEGLAGRTRSGRLTWYRAVLTQGWRRQLRRMFATAEAPVERLIRVRIGTLRLDGLKSGEIRPLTAPERDRLVQSTVDPDEAAVAGDAAGRPGGDRRQVTVAIDGPGSSGKSSVGSAAAAAIGYRFCDTGVLYRGLAWLAADRRVPATDGAALVALIPQLHLAPDEAGRLARVVVDGRDVTGELHEARVDRLVSGVAADPGVRAAFLPVQRELAAAGGIVMAGRDIGSVVLPDAELRLWLEVSLGERAARRARQRGLDPAGREGQAILEDLRRRDATDSGRETAPLRVPDGAIIIDADDLSFDRTVAAVIGAIRTAERQAAATAAARRPHRLPPATPMSGSGLPLWPRTVALVCRVVARCTMRIRVEGLENVPREGALIVAPNHISNVDPPLIGGWLGPALDRRPRFLAKEQLFKGVVGWFLRSQGVIAVKAGGSDVDAYRVARGLLDAGGVMVIFPEGTRSMDGGLGQPKPGVTLLASRGGVPVLPIGISGTDDFLRRGQSLPNIGARVVVRIGKPYQPVVERTGDRRAGLAVADAELMRRIATLVEPRHRGGWEPWQDA